MTKTLIFGHKSPDTDTICSAISYAYLKNKIGTDAEPVRLGPINKETNFALDYFNQEVPREIDKVSNEAVILVDHNEFQQSVDNIAEANIIEVIDHHRIANFETKDPVLFRTEPVGCTATILKKIYKENDIEIPKEIAGLLLSAIISDSLLLKSPTCTEQDVNAAKELAKIAEVDIDTYGLDMLKAGADLSESSVAELITMDAKEFTMNGQKVEIAQVNAVDIDNILQKQEELTAAINETVETKELELFLFVVTDILENNSEVLAIGNGKAKVETAFSVSLKENRAFLKGVVSRKKQIVTNLTEAFNN